MSLDDLLNVVPWLLAAVVWALALGVSLGHFWAAAGVEGFEAGFSGGPEDLVPEGDDPLYASFYRQLQELGFVPAGVTWEKVRGKPPINSFAFLHPTETGRASLWRALGGDFRAYFVTQFTDGTCVLT